MIGRTNAGGGGGGLNFKVVGGTSQPANPKENTIWVNTQTEISGWAFSATEPGSPVEGMVWIDVGSSSPVAMNVISKNSIFVYPLSVYQYIYSAWVNKSAISYIGGEWRDFITYLYNDGRQYHDITGGWIKTGSGTFDLAENHMQIGPANKGNNVRGVTNNKVDVSDLRSLKLIYTCTNAAAYSRFGISTTTGPTDSGGWVSYANLKTTTQDAEINLDISGITGSYYITISTYTSDSTSTIIVKKVLGVP